MASISRFQWDDKATWPRDSPDHVFLGRAVEALGSARFNGEWTGQEGALAYKKLNQSLLLKEVDQTQIARFDKVAEEIVDASVAGRLTTAIRSQEGGEFPSQLPAEVWNNEVSDKWIATCCHQQWKTDLISATSWTTDFWIYLDKASFETMLGLSAYSAMTAEMHLSPYLRLMLTVCREMEISSTNQPLKKDVERELRAASKRPGMSNMSETLIKFAASLMREPESQSGTVYRARKEKK